MQIDQSTVDNAVQFLTEGQEFESANLLRSCTLEDCDIVDHWRDGARTLSGIFLELACTRSIYEVLSNDNDIHTKSIKNAFHATFPTDCYLKTLRFRAVPSAFLATEQLSSKLTDIEIQELTTAIELQKALMISVATGGPRIKGVNPEYENRRLEIKGVLDTKAIADPNPYPDLWSWYGKWSDGSLPTYQSRRKYVAEMYQPLLDFLCTDCRPSTLKPAEPTGWARVDRNIDKIVKALEMAKNEEDFQGIALLCREAIISLAQAVYVPTEHDSLDGVTPSSTDAKRMLESYIAKILEGASHDYHRKFAKAAFDLAVNLQHRRTAEFRDAALCADATRSVVNIIAVISGQRDPEK
ncbi:MAG: hypothetical protein KBB23_07735 [Smithella sp.]|jgi:hypothetical protein|nr:hypothetical protein [Smithella sp.]